MRLRRPSLTALRRHVSRDFGGPFQDGSLVVAMQDQPSSLLFLLRFARRPPPPSFPPFSKATEEDILPSQAWPEDFHQIPVLDALPFPNRKISRPPFSLRSRTNFFLLLLDFSIRGETFRKIREDGKKKMLELGGTKGWKEGVESHRAMRISRGGGFVSLHALRGITESESRWSRPPSSNFSRERNNGLKEACDPERRGEK